MARLITCGFEQQQYSATVSAAEGQGFAATNGAGGTAPAIDTTVKRSGAAALRLANKGFSYWDWNGGVASNDRWYYFRTYFRFSAAPSAQFAFITVEGGTSNHLLEVKLNTDRTIRMYRASGATAVGSASSALSVDTWYRVEVGINVPASGTSGQCELRIDGTTVASGTADLTNGAPRYWILGDYNFVSPGINCYFDDVALNDDQGSSQNSWPGDGKILLLAGKGAGAYVTPDWSTSFFTDDDYWSATSHQPPIGAASPAHETQIQNDAANDTSYAVPVLQTPAEAGMATNEVIMVAQAVAQIGANAASAQSAKLERYNGSTYAEAGTGSTPAAAIGTSPTNWATFRSVVKYVPTYPNRTQDSLVKLTRQTAAGGRLWADWIACYIEVSAGQSIATGLATETDTGLATVPPTPTITSGTPDAWGRVALSVDAPYSTSLRVWVSTASGGTFEEITSSVSSSRSGNTYTITDKRPADPNRSQKVAVGSTAHYKVSAINGAAESSQTSVTSVLTGIVKETVEKAAWDRTHSDMSVQATREDNSHLGYANAGYFLVCAARAAQWPDKRTEALTDLRQWWSGGRTGVGDGVTIQNQIRGDGLWLANGYTTYLQAPHNYRMIRDLLVSARLLRQLTGDSTALTLASELVAAAENMGKAMINLLAKNTIRHRGYGAHFPDNVAAASARSAVTYPTGSIVKGGSRMFRALTVDGLAGTSTGADPTWPTSDRAMVADKATVSSITGVASTGVFTAVSHGLSTGDLVVIRDLTGGSGLSTQRTYAIDKLTNDTFRLGVDPYSPSTNLASFTTNVTSMSLMKYVSGNIMWHDCTNDVPTWTAGEAVTPGVIRRAPDSSSWTFTRSGTTGSFSETITGLSTTTDLAAGMRVSGSGIPTNAVIIEITSSTSIKLNVIASASATTTLTFSGNRTFRCTTGGICQGTTPTFPNTDGGTLTESGGVQWKETTRTVSLFSEIYDPTTLAAIGIGGGVSDFLMEGASAFSLLLNDVDATAFKTSGSHQASGQATCDAFYDLLTTQQADGGRIIQGRNTLEQYDPSYGSFTYQGFGIMLAVWAGSSWSRLTEAGVVASKIADWLDSYSTEPVVSANMTPIAYPQYRYELPQLCWRWAGYAATNRSYAIDTLIWTAALHPGANYIPGGQSGGTDGGEVNFLTSVGIFQSLPFAMSQAVGIGVETDTAGNIIPAIEGDIAIAPEADSGLEIIPQTSVSQTIGVGSEIDYGLSATPSLGSSQSVTVDVASEIDSGLEITTVYPETGSLDNATIFSGSDTYSTTITYIESSTLDASSTASSVDVFNVFGEQGSIAVGTTLNGSDAYYSTSYIYDESSSLANQAAILGVDTYGIPETYNELGSIGNAVALSGTDGIFYEVLMEANLGGSPQFTKSVGKNLSKIVRPRTKIRDNRFYNELIINVSALPRISRVITRRKTHKPHKVREQLSRRS